MHRNTGKSYSLYKRKTSSGIVYYVRWRKPDGSWSSGRSTGCQSKRQTEAACENQLIATGRAAPSRRLRFSEYASDFWSPDGRYVELRRAHGYSLGATYVKNQQRLVDAYLIPAFGMRPIDEISSQSIEAYLFDLYKNGRRFTLSNGTTKVRMVSASQVNNIRKCLNAIFDEAYRTDLVASNPVKRVRPFKETPRQRGILTVHEIRQLVDPEATDEVWPAMPECNSYSQPPW